MKRQVRIVSSILLIALLLALTTLPAASQTSRAELMKKSSIIFVGTVTQKNAVSFAPVLKSPRTMVVRVDTVLEKPSSVMLGEGASVTIEATDPAPFNEGTQATFYAVGWIFGEGVAVREVGHELSPVAAVAEIGNQEEEQEVVQARQELQDAEMRTRIQAADMVVVGRVTEIRPSSIPQVPEQPQRMRITEHAPDWQEAVIRVESSIKGAEANQEIIVRFPGSMDVAWYGVPKFKMDQEGTFILKMDSDGSATGAAVAMLANAPVDAYTALNAQDVLSKEDAQRIRALAEQ